MTLRLRRPAQLVDGDVRGLQRSTEKRVDRIARRIAALRGTVAAQDHPVGAHEVGRMGSVAIEAAEQRGRARRGHHARPRQARRAGYPAGRPQDPDHDGGCAESIGDRQPDPGCRACQTDCGGLANAQRRLR